jgi:hypothetical protein
MALQWSPAGLERNFSCLQRLPVDTHAAGHGEVPKSAAQPALGDLPLSDWAKDGAVENPARQTLVAAGPRVAATCRC